MAGTRKSAKRTARKKSGKRASAKKSAGRKSASKRATKSGRRSKSTKARRTGNLKRQAQKGLRVARGGIDTVRQVGDRAWETLKTTTAQVVDGVKETLNREEKDSRDRYPYR